jgi:hypothetical protein
MAQPRPPDFLCIGAAKTGTTWLYNILASCPGYWMTPVSELRYFGRKDGTATGEPVLSALENYHTKTKVQLDWVRRYVNGSPKDDAWYFSLFADAGNCITGDVSPAYSKLPARHIEHAKRAAPDATAIMFVRNPIDRAMSHAVHVARQKTFKEGSDSFAAGALAVQLGLTSNRLEGAAAFHNHYRVPWESRPDLNFILETHNAATKQNITFSDLVRSSEIRISADVVRESLKANPVSHQNEQARAIRRWREVFGDRFHVFLHDDLCADPSAFLASVTETLGHPSKPIDPELPRKSFNVGFYEAAEGLDEIRAEIAPTFEGEIAALRELLGARVDIWTRPSQP